MHPDAARQINLNKKKAAMEAKQWVKLDKWCVDHDKDGDGEFDRDELRDLLNALHPEQEVADEKLDDLIIRATGVYTSSLTMRRGRWEKLPLHTRVVMHGAAARVARLRVLPQPSGAAVGCWWHVAAVMRGLWHFFHPDLGTRTAR